MNHNNSEARATFLFCFFMERLGRYRQVLESRINPNKKTYASRSASDTADFLTACLVSVSSGDICHRDCKGMYFCELAEGHDGNHREGGLVWPNGVNNKPLNVEATALFKKLPKAIQKYYEREGFSANDVKGIRRGQTSARITWSLDEGCDKRADRWICQNREWYLRH